MTKTKMGGFTLTGPHHVFKSTASTNPCFCVGLHAFVDEDTDRRLASAPVKTVDAGLLHRLNAGNVHVGDQLTYTVHALPPGSRRSPFVPRAPAPAPEAFSSWNQSQGSAF